MISLHLDFETRSELDLTRVGAWAYAAHPSTEIICVGVAVGDGKPILWKAPEVRRGPRYAGAQDILSSTGRLVAHNVQFEYAVYHFILHLRYGWPELLDPRRWDCTMARALACGLPASLEGLSLSLKLPFQKDLEGRAALLKICKPVPKTGGWNEDLALYERVYKYNALDVQAERAADKALPPLTPEERRLFELDLIINRRGLGIDLPNCRLATEIAGGFADELNCDLHRLTGGAVSAASRIQEMKRWVASQGVAIPTKTDRESGVEKETLDIEAVKDLVKDAGTPELVKRVLGIRQQVGKSSVAKFKAMLNCACADGRVRGAFQYHGAHTGRWAGRLVQPTNFPQGFADFEEQEAAISMLSQGAGFYRAVYAEKAMQALSDSLRGMIVPASGKAFVDADLNAIECRVLNWLAGEEWVLGLFERKESPYIRMAEAIYEKKGISKKGTPQEYDIGKRSELGCGFGMGWRRFQANVYTETSKRGEGVWLSDPLAQKAVKVYRAMHVRVVALWYATEAAAIKAVQNPGCIFVCADGRVRWGMSKDRRFLCCQLPSGRLMRYFRPEVEVEENPSGGDPKASLTYWTAAGEGAMTTDPSTNGLLGKYRTWGGELVENVVQAVARDVMVHGMLRAEDSGFRVVLHNYDELCVEVGIKTADEDNLNRLMNNMTLGLPAWAKGLPVAAEGWVGARYRK